MIPKPKPKLDSAEKIVINGKPQSHFARKIRLKDKKINPNQIVKDLIDKKKREQDG